ncbi:MAG: HAMP domain-containing sensor histidine kinase, partial [Longimicrobiales bacterium]|nr:HAMP domain-containing sensor histidine kinase [Longimicrobiales bacterium]
PVVELEEQIRHIRFFVGWTVLATLLWAVLVSLLLARRIAGPIQEMQAATARIAAGDLGQRVPVRTADELGDLARSLNYMAAELERLDATRREFVADASHELRTPVANLAVAVSALCDTIPCPDPASAALLDAVGQEVERLRSLVGSLLDLSAVESGRVHLHLVPVDLGDVASRVVESFRPRGAQQGVTLGQSGPPRGVRVHADSDRMEQVLGNLLDNALKFTPSGGCVTVRVTTGSDDGSVRVSVEDTGRGIPAEAQERLFQRMYQAEAEADAAVSRRGLGLGLYISSEIVNRLGGRIWVESEVGRGSTFHFTLPLAHEEG